MLHEVLAAVHDRPWPASLHPAHMYDFIYTQTETLTPNTFIQGLSGSVTMKGPGLDSRVTLSKVIPSDYGSLKAPEIEFLSVRDQGRIGKTVTLSDDHMTSRVPVFLPELSQYRKINIAIGWEKRLFRVAIMRVCMNLFRNSNNTFLWCI